MLVCPVDDCITMVKKDTGKKPMSWRQYQAELSRDPKCKPPGYIEH
jgi:hypothetical protein